MNNYARIAFAAAALLVVVIVGYNLLPRTGGFGGTPTAVPTVAPTVAPQPSPTATTIRPPANGSIAPGTYGWSWTGGHLEFEMPSGWTAFENGLLLSKQMGTTAAVELATWFPGGGFEVTRVYADACHSEGQLMAVGPSVADLVAALDAQLSTDATISDSSLEGAAPKRVDLASTPGLDRATCRHGAAGPVQIWADPNEINYFALAPGHTGFAYVVDVGGARLVLSGDRAADASAADIAELDAILDSFRIQP